MKTIDLAIWEPNPERKGTLRYVGQPKAEAVFKELKYRLESMGMLPDEYFLMDREWEKGREIPKDASVFVTTDYGSSEGIYLDVYLKWYDESSKTRMTKSFATGKTLGETGADLDRMFLISSAITKAFNGYGRHEERDSMVVSLTPEEQSVLIDALVERHDRQLTQLDGTEKLLRRMTGSITAYMDTVGRKPLHMSAHDRAMLAIRDGELEAFRDSLPEDNRDALLTAAAARPGAVGRKMTLLLLDASSDYDPEQYALATANAVSIADMERAKFLVEQAETHTVSLPDDYYSCVLRYTLRKDPVLAEELFGSYTPEQTAKLSPDLLTMAVKKERLRLASALIKKGIPSEEIATELLQRTLSGDNSWIAHILIRDGLRVDPQDYAVLDACVSEGAVGTAKLLLDHGFDFDGYLAQCGDKESHTLDELKDYWNTLDEQTPEMGGMTM